MMKANKVLQRKSPDSKIIFNDIFKKKMEKFQIIQIEKNVKRVNRKHDKKKGAHNSMMGKSLSLNCLRWKFHPFF